jgi:uncharacterized protein
MSTLWKIVSIVTLLAVVAVAALLVTSRNPVVFASPSTQTQAAALGTNGSTPSGISISAQGTAQGAPDVAYVTLGVQSTATTAADAMNQTSSAMTAIISKLQGLGIDKKDIKTGVVNLQPQMNQPKGDQNAAPVIVGYFASNTLRITVNDLTKVGSALDVSLAAGANSIQGVQFDIKDDSALQNQALTDAVKTARARADVVAAGLGLKVTGVQSVQINSYTPVPFSGGVMAAAPRAAVDNSVPVEAGQISVTASVQVTFNY